MITKSYTENIILEAVNENYDGILYTAVVSEHEKKPFFPTFFQDKIEKESEKTEIKEDAESDEE